MPSAIEAPVTGAVWSCRTSHAARIVRIYQMVENNYLFTLHFVDEKWDFPSGTSRAVCDASIPGTGEAPISISSSPSRPGVLELCVRRAGAGHQCALPMKTNDLVSLRRPYGNGFR